MEQKIKSIIDQLKVEINDVKDLESLKQIKAKYTSKSDFFIALKDSIKTAENKQEVGSQIKMYTEGVNSILEEKKDYLENSFFMEERENPILKDSSFSLEEKEGNIHPLTELTMRVAEYFDKLNYHYAHGIEVETQ